MILFLFAPTGWTLVFLHFQIASFAEQAIHSAKLLSIPLRELVSPVVASPAHHEFPLNSPERCLIEIFR